MGLFDEIKPNRDKSQTRGEIRRHVIAVSNAPFEIGCICQLAQQTGYGQSRLIIRLVRIFAQSADFKKIFMGGKEPTLANIWQLLDKPSREKMAVKFPSEAAKMVK